MPDHLYNQVVMIINEIYRLIYRFAAVLEAVHYTWNIIQKEIVHKSCLVLLAAQTPDTFL